MAGDVPGTAPDDTAPDSTPDSTAPGPSRPAAPAGSAVPAPAAPLALYRRYRPATFAEVKGQEHVTEPLRQALRNGRVHHAYLFSGPRGCGKTSSARILARSLNCEQGPTPDPCGSCASCVALAPSGPGSIDVIEIDAASHGGVDDARELRERAFYAPVAARFKIYIIDEAHMVTREGFNALLKLVEEPPPHLKFVFATTEPEKVIPTIRSRTHHYPFRLVPPAVLRELMEEILASEGIRCEPAVLPLVVRAGAGSARDSLSVLDQLLAGAGEEGLTYERTVALLGYTDDSLLDDMVGAFAAGDGAAVFAVIDKVVEGGHDPRRFAADLLDRCRDLIVLAAVPGAGQTGLLDVPADRLERMAEQAGRLGQAELTRTAGIISEGLIQMRGATSPRLLLELMCAQVLLPGAGTGEKALLARVERLERKLENAGPPSPAGRPANQAPTPPAAAGTVRQPGGPGQPPRRQQEATRQARPPSGPPAAPASRGQAPHDAAPRDAAPRDGAPRDGAPRDQAPASPAPAPPPAAAPPPAGTVDASLVRQRWPEILEAVKGERRVAWLLLSNASVHSLEDGVLVIGFAKEGEARGFAASGYDQDLIRVLGGVLGVRLRVRALAGVPAGGQAGARAGSAGSGATAAAPPSPAPHRTDPPPAGHSGPARGSSPSGQPGQPGQPTGRPPRPAAAPGPVSPGAPPPGAPAGAPPPSASRAAASRTAASRTAASRTAGPPQPAPAAADWPEEDWPDEPSDPADSMPAPEALSGMELIARQLGGRVIEEIDGQ